MEDTIVSPLPASKLADLFELVQQLQCQLLSCVKKLPNCGVRISNCRQTVHGSACPQAERINADFRSGLTCLNYPSSTHDCVNTNHVMGYVRNTS